MRIYRLNMWWAPQQSWFWYNCQDHISGNVFCVAFYWNKLNDWREW